MAIYGMKLARIPCKAGRTSLLHEGVAAAILPPGEVSCAVKEKRTAVNFAMTSNEKTECNYLISMICWQSVHHQAHEFLVRMIYLGTSTKSS